MSNYLSSFVTAHGVFSSFDHDLSRASLSDVIHILPDIIHRFRGESISACSCRVWQMELEFSSSASSHATPKRRASFRSQLLPKGLRLLSSGCLIFWLCHGHSRASLFFLLPFLSSTSFFVIGRPLLNESDRTIFGLFLPMNHTGHKQYKMGLDSIYSFSVVKVANIVNLYKNLIHL